MGNIFDAILINPAINLIVYFYKTILSAGVPYPLGFSIIAITVLLKIVMHPLTLAQLRSAAKMRKLQPHLEKAKEKHGQDKARLQQETMKLYKEHGVNPAAGCLPLLIQFPIFIALYQVLVKIVSVQTDEAITAINNVLYSPSLHLDKPLDPNFFGLSLSATPSQWSQYTPLLLLVPVVTGVLQFIQSKMMMPSLSTPATGKKGEKKGDDFQRILQTQMTYFLPVMIGVFSYTFPLGLSLYWNVFSLLGIIQQYYLEKTGKV